MPSNRMEDHQVLGRPDDEFAIYDKLRRRLKLDHGAVCGIMANICAESDFDSRILQNSYARRFGLSSAEYTDRVDSGLIAREQFANDHAGYGICQWTFYSRKENLYRFLKSRRLSIGDLKGQTEFLIHELETDFAEILAGLRKKGRDCSVLIKGQQYRIETRDVLERAYDAAVFFCAVFEEPDESVFEEQCRERGRLAMVLYARYGEAFASGFSDGNYWRGRSAQARKRRYRISDSIEDIYLKNILRRDYSFISDIAACMKKTIVSVEDLNFRRHRGVDLLKTIQALVKIISSGRRTGASTITQQLARNLYLSREKTLIRKLREMRIARYIEKRLSKDRILELYLNIIYYGHGAYGIKNASSIYFNCRPSMLEAYQSVALCAVIPAPSRFNPYADSELFVRRSKVALGVLLKHGDIDLYECEQIIKEEKAFADRVEERSAIISENRKKSYRRLIMNKGLSGWNNYRDKIDQCTDRGGDTPETFQKYRVDYNESLKKKMQLCTYPALDGEKFQFHHLFFHSLILEPEKAFEHVSGDEDFESWFVSLDEFRKILISLYERGYVLVDMRRLLAGQVQLPKGKTPLVLSFDDMNYYDYMKGYGFVSRMVPDEEGDISYIKEDGDKSYEVKYGDSVTVLEEFILEHPDFSWDNARGIIGLTGYEGLLGYRDLKDPMLCELVKRLKSMGWDFACHSYRHRSRIYNNDIPNAPEGIADVDRWLEGPGKVLGATDIFITPFGADIRNNPQLLKYLKDKGFVYFCNVADRRSVETDGESFYIQRYSVDGVMMQNRSYDFEFYYGDLSRIYDTRRKKPLCTSGLDAQSLVRHAYTCMRMPNIYGMGGIGHILTKDWLAKARRDLPDSYSDNDSFEMLWNIPNGEIRCFDCSGLIKRFLMGGMSHFSYDKALDMNAFTMLDKARVKGEIDSIPDQAGICVYMPGHVGIYVGKGRVIESTPDLRYGNGVIMTRLSERGWTHWFRLTGISYDRS